MVFRTPPDMAKICRVCLRSDRTLCHIFDEQFAEGDHCNLAQLLMQCSKYIVKEDDELPQQLCNVCKTNARIALRFKRECEASYRQLSMLLGRNVSEHVDVKQDTEFENNRVEQGTQTEQSGTCTTASKSESSRRGKQNECQVCHRQFSRRDHMSRHLAVMHKIVVAPICSSEDEQSSTTATDQADSKLQSRTHSIGGIAIETSSAPTMTESTPKDELEYFFDTAEMAVDDLSNCGEYAQHVYGFDEPESNVDNILLKGEDEQPLVTLIEESKENKTFIKVLLNESGTMELTSCGESQTSSSTLFREKVDATTEQPATEFKRKRGRPPRIKNKVIKRKMALKNSESQDEFVEQIEPALDSSTSPLTLQAEASASKTHQCKVCQKCFTTHIYLRRHAAIHERKRFVCKECAKCYLTKDELALHVKMEGHDKPMLCPECGLRCKTSNNLTVHMRRHKGEKPFKCKFCSKGFPRVDDLRVHEKYHTGEKSHFCETCGKGFQRKYNLTIHLRVHTGERPYKCPHCPQAFAQGNDLKAHIRRHTGERFRCELCDAAFLQIYQIRHHKLLQHGIKEEPPTQRVAKFTSREAQEQQIKRNLQQELTAMEPTAAPETATATLEPTDSFVLC